MVWQMLSYKVCAQNEILVSPAQRWPIQAGSCLLSVLHLERWDPATVPIT